MTAEVDLCNRALSLVGTRSTIASLTEASTEASQCALHYAAARDWLLRLHNWSFARRQVGLPLFAAAANTPENPGGAAPFPPNPWDYEYLLPTDCLRVRQILPPLAVGTGLPDPLISYTLSADLDGNGNVIKVLLTNQTQATLVYTMRITVVDLFDVEFQEALVQTLASRLVGPLTGDKQLAQVFMQAANAAVLTARSVDGSEEPGQQEHVPDWIRVRGLSADYATDSGALFNAVMVP